MSSYKRPAPPPTVSGLRKELAAERSKSKSFQEELKGAQETGNRWAERYDECCKTTGELRDKLSTANCEISSLRSQLQREQTISSALAKLVKRFF